MNDKPPPPPPPTQEGCEKNDKDDASLMLLPLHHNNKRLLDYVWLSEIGWCKGNNPDELWGKKGGELVDQSILRYYIE